ncbi:hypothetical protein GH714_015258 [Hevea brasiliensis]|uniref:Uncharacterized protein n=1 Tax=Hevea brasiliensis TaxID=3981 RepID=A0A6A6KIS7_HEVBR|nr:hypothetical protein GH714_015258 [Hevea brasiliensis]
MEKIIDENEVEQVKLLAAINDDHEGAIVELSEPMHPEDFASMLRASIAHWRKQEGFWYHHAEPKYLMLIYWIPEGTHTLPANASHRVGIGAFVMNEKREVLVVQEKNGILRGKGVWKFPTGTVDEIDAEFVEVLAFRQSHGEFFDKSDLCFICLLQPLSFDIQKQESEIDAAQWMPLDEYRAQPFVQKSEPLKYFFDLCLAKIDNKYSGFSPVPNTSNIPDEKGYLYVNSRYLSPPVRSGYHLPV